MTENGLRPIGTEIEIVYPPSTNSLDFTIWRYKISEHSQMSRFAGDEKGKWVETIIPVRIEDNPRHLAPEAWMQWCDMLRPVPPKEAALLLDAGWQALREHWEIAMGNQSKDGETL